MLKTQDSRRKTSPSRRLAVGESRPIVARPASRECQLAERREYRRSLFSFELRELTFPARRVPIRD